LNKKNKGNKMMREKIKKNQEKGKTTEKKRAIKIMRIKLDTKTK